MEELTFQLGAKLEAARKARGLTLQEVADAIGVSPSLISKLEHDKVNVSINTLKRVCSFLGIRMASLFEDSEVAVGKLVTADRRLQLPTTDPASVLEMIISKESQLLEVSQWTLAPGYASSVAQPHEGEEFVLVLSGKLVYQIDTEEYLLGPGDAIFHRADVVHWWSNASDGQTVILSVEARPGRQI